MTPAAITALQRSVGNQAVSRMIETTAVQRARTGPRPGTYGYKKRERDELGEEFHTRVSGTEFHSEHIHAFSNLHRSSGMRRGQSGPAGQEIRNDEAISPAYLERAERHRAHPGTGTRREREPYSGMTQADYLRDQYTAISNNDPFTSHLLNQSGYYQQPGWQDAHSVSDQVSDRSHDNTLRANQPVPYRTPQGERRETRVMTPNEQADAAGNRRYSRGHRYPSAREQQDILDEWGAHGHYLRERGRYGRP